MKYSIPDHNFQSKKYRDIGVAGGKKVRVYEDGSIEAESFKDKSHEDVDFEYDKKNNTVFFKKNINDNLGVKLVPNAFKVFIKQYVKKPFL